MAKWYHQVQDYHFQEMFSPDVKYVTIRVILTLAITRQWHVTQLNVNNVFLNGLLI